MTDAAPQSSPGPPAGRPDAATVTSAATVQRPWWARLRNLSIIAALGAVGAAAAGKIATDVVTEQVKRGIGAAVNADTICLVGEWLRERFSRPDPPDPERFTVLIVRLDRDPDGTFTTHLLDAFRGAQGIRRRESCIAIEAGRTGESEAKAVIAAEDMRLRRSADLVVWGEVADAKDRAIRVWFTASDQRPDLSVRPWRFERGTLEPGFSNEFATALQALALSGVRNPLEKSDQLVAESIRPLLPRMRTLLHNPPPGLTAEGRLELRIAVAQALFAYAMQIGEDQPLREAVSVYETALKDDSRSSAADIRVRLQNDLGLMLFGLSTFGDHGALQRARQALEAAVSELDRQGTSSDRVLVLGNLALVLQSLGVRGDFAAFDRSLEIYDDALRTLSREKEPIPWAMAQNNLGILLMSLGIRRGDAGLLRSATTRFEAALRELDSRRGSEFWAQIQMNIGTSLSSSGEPGSLPDAIAAFDAALGVFSRERSPLNWAGAQMGRGNALKALAQHGDDASIDGAVEAFRQALLEYKRDRSPMMWAYTQNNLGLALQVRGSRGDEASLREAVEAHRAALLELTRTTIPQDWAATQSYLGIALFALGSRGDAISLQEAIKAFEAALTEIPRDRMPVPWAQQELNLAMALRVLGDAAALRRSVAAYEEALEVFKDAGEQEIAARISAEIETTRKQLLSTEQQAK